MRVRRGSGGREGELLKSAKRLRESVDPLIPELRGEAPKDRFEKLRGELESVRENRDDEKALERASGRWGEPLARAYAGLLKFYLDPDLPALVVAPFPGGDVPFAPLGRAPPEAHIAVQQFSDPRRLLYGYLEWARKGLHFFASPDTLYCTGRSPRPPPEFLSTQLAGLPYRLNAADDGRIFQCAHLGGATSVPFLEVVWGGADRRFRVCARCVRDDRQLLARLTTGVAGPSPEDEFVVGVDLNIRCGLGGRCVHQRLPELSKATRRAYVLGRISDRELLDNHKAEVGRFLDGVREPLFVAGGRCFGSDRAAFLAAMEATPDERRALDEVLPSVEGRFEIDEAVASRALERLWPTHADAIVRAIVPDEAEAERLVNEARASPGRVSELLRRAAESGRARARGEALPQYDHLSREAAFVDGVARVQRIDGPAAAERKLLQSLPREGKERGLAFGLLRALGRGEAHAWQFSDTERQFGAALEPLAVRLLTGPAGEYHEALTALLATAGVAEWGRRHDSGP
jgi:hypothetical protein